MNSNNRDFKGIWIPKELYLNENLNWTEKILLIEIDSLDNSEGCYASNEYFANFLDKSKRWISKSISKLKKLGYIYQESFDGRHRILRSNINFKLNYASNTDDNQGGTKVPGRTELKFQPIYNNTINNKESSSRAIKRSNKTLKKKTEAGFDNLTNDDDDSSYQKKKNKRNKKTKKDSALEEKLKLLKDFGIQGSNLAKLSKNKTLNIIKLWIDYIKLNKNINNQPAYLVSALNSGNTPPEINNTNNTSSNGKGIETGEKISKATNFLKQIDKDDINYVPHFIYYLEENSPHLLEVFKKDYHGLPRAGELHNKPNDFIYDTELKLIMQVYKFSKLIKNNPTYFDSKFYDNAMPVL